MVSKNVVAVYLAGLVQGLALVSFPAASSVFTSPHAFNLSNAAYGGLFIPEAVLSIIASLLSARFAQLKGIKLVFLVGLAANLVAMFLFSISAFFIERQTVAYGILLLATTSLGIGFGLTVPVLNNYAALFFPTKIDSAVLILNALLGIGTALAPLFVVIFIDFGFWWGLPTLLTLLFLSLLIFSFPLPLQAQSGNHFEEIDYKPAPLPKLFWIFGACALLYGILETISGNWATIYMEKYLHATAALASLALCLFWAMVTLGRIFFSVFARFFSSQKTFCLLPFVLALAFLIFNFLSSDQATLGVVIFALAGFGCSALLPLIISYGDQAFPKMQTKVTGNLIALYLLGYGIAAFGIGSLQERTGWSLPSIFGIGTIIAIMLGILTLTIIFFLGGPDGVKRKSSASHRGQ